MKIAFQIVLIIIMLMSLLGSVGDKDKEDRQRYTAMVIACIVAFIITLKFL